MATVTWQLNKVRRPRLVTTFDWRRQGRPQLHVSRVLSGHVIGGEDEGEDEDEDEPDGGDGEDDDEGEDERSWWWAGKWGDGGLEEMGE